jgi:glycosyltransferase involved in cell wall biosynthesis
MKVAFVVQRAGLEVNGGAEALCLQLAQRMAAHWNTEVLTTCALDYMTWENFYPAGEEKAGPTLIRRFPVDVRRDVPAFNRLSEKLVAKGKGATLQEQETWMQAQGPISTALLDYLRTEQGSYDLYIFFGYLYATTYFGLPLVKDRALLAPLGHDEWTIYFPMWDQFFALPSGFIFNTPEERSFLVRRFPALSLPGPVIGIGVAPPDRGLAPREFREKYSLTEPFLLYAGRIDAAKGCDQLFEYFIRLRQETDLEYKLVLIGAEVLPVPFHEDIVYLGFVDDTEKWNALAACDWLVLPSRHESLSIILLEAWSVGRPAIVAEKCEVAVGHCRRANAGLWYESYETFKSILSGVDSATRARLGQNGRAYVSTNYSWTRVEADYLSLAPQGDRMGVAPMTETGYGHPRA